MTCTSFELSLNVEIESRLHGTGTHTRLCGVVPRQRIVAAVPDIAVDIAAVLSVHTPLRLRLASQCFVYYLLRHHICVNLHCLLKCHS